MHKLSKKTVYILKGLLAVFALVFVLYHYGFSIYTYIWHLKNSAPVELSHLKVTIPDSLVGKIGQNEILEITYLKDPLVATMYVRILDYEPGGNGAGSTGLIEKSACRISGKECIKVTFKRNEIETGYIEDLYLPEERAYISFQGNRSARGYLLELIKNLEVT